MASVSILVSLDAPGDGGGVCSYAVRPLLFGRSAKVTVLDAVDDVVEERGRDGDVGDGELDGCDRLIRFDGG